MVLPTLKLFFDFITNVKTCSQTFLLCFLKLTMQWTALYHLLSYHLYHILSLITAAFHQHLFPDTQKLDQNHITYLHICNCPPAGIIIRDTEFPCWCLKHLAVTRRCTHINISIYTCIHMYVHTQNHSTFKCLMQISHLLLKFGWSRTLFSFSEDSRIMFRRCKLRDMV